MSRRVVILVLFACAHVEWGDAGVSSRVVGGRDAKEGAYPYQASIRVHGIHKCGGSIVGQRWILTAAHCLKYEKESIAVVVGTNSLLTGGMAYRPIELCIYPYYNKKLHLHDIGLIKIASDIVYGTAVAPVGLPGENVNDDDCTASFTGWGNIETNGSNYNQLQVIDLRVLPLDKCAATFSKVGSTHICTLTVAGEGICYGDSGSPLVANGVQIAIGSWGSPCAAGYPDVHTRVYSYVDWIKRHTEVRNPTTEEGKPRDEGTFLAHLRRIVRHASDRLD